MKLTLGENEVTGYEPLVSELKDLIQKKQYNVMQMMNSETIYLYWETVEEIYKKQDEHGWGTGIPRLLREMLEYGLRAPEFIDMEVALRVNLYRKDNLALAVPDSARKVPESATKIPEKNNISDQGEFLTDQEKKIKKYRSLFIIGRLRYDREKYVIC